MGGSGKEAGKKRKFHDRSGPKRKHTRNPRRGAPGVLLTCETGREVKCQREGLEILNFYYPSIEDAEEKEGKGETKSLSLEDELKMLKSKPNKSSQSRFGVYETGCRGTVFVLSTVPGSNLIPPINKESHEGGEKLPGKGEEEDESATGPLSEEPPSTKQRQLKEGDKSCQNEEKASVAKVSGDSPPQSTEPDSVKNIWDPLATVSHILSDRRKGKEEAPSSRFVTRMIPIQATCFASVEEINLTSRALLQKFLPPKAQSFAIATKRRHCGNLTRTQVIDTIGENVAAVLPKATVDLSNPDVTIVVEVCCTLCGISVIPSSAGFGNFSLVVNENKED